MFKKFKISSFLSSLCDDSDHTVEKVHLGCKDCILKSGKCMSNHLGGGGMKGSCTLWTGLSASGGGHPRHDISEVALSVPVLPPPGILICLGIREKIHHNTPSTFSCIELVLKFTWIEMYSSHSQIMGWMQPTDILCLCSVRDPGHISPANAHWSRHSEWVSLVRSCGLSISTQPNVTKL